MANGPHCNCLPKNRRFQRRWFGVFEKNGLFRGRVSSNFINKSLIRSFQYYQTDCSTWRKISRSFGHWIKSAWRCEISLPTRYWHSCNWRGRKQLSAFGSFDIDANDWNCLEPAGFKRLSERVEQRPKYTRFVSHQKCQSILFENIDELRSRYFNPSCRQKSTFWRYN